MPTAFRFAISIALALALFLAPIAASSLIRNPASQTKLCSTPQIAIAPPRACIALRWDPALAAAAHQHALRMAQANQLSHQFPGEPPVQDRARQAGARFSVIAENVAQGPSVAGLHTQWMNSAAASRQSSRPGAQRRRHLRRPVWQHLLRRRRFLRLRSHALSR